jgi:hypothetical protein
MRIDGFQSIWSVPWLQGTGSYEYWMQDYELLTMVLSALMWRKENGDIRLMADEPAAEFIEKKGLSHIWNLGVEIFSVPKDINPRVYWAAGKLYALRQLHMPAVMIDLDLIIWKNITDTLAETDICCIHREGLYPDVYPDISFFNMKEGYSFNPNWNYDIYPANTCMLYLADENFKNYYTDTAIDFMKNTAETDENLCHMVFAEQRLLAMCAWEREKEISSFFPGSGDIEGQDVFTHLWGFKNMLKYDYNERMAYNKRLADRIVKEFPMESETLGRLDIAGVSVL